jgi:O-antigen/teichoic acid export membrane protein
MSRRAQRVAVAAAPVAPRTTGRGLVGNLASGRVDAAGTYVLQVGSLGLGFLSQLAVARLAGISGYGTYSYALAWSAMVVQPSLLGLDRVLIRELATYRQARAFGLMRGLLRRSDQVAVVVAVAFAALVAAVALPVSDSAMRASVALGLLTIPLAALGRVRQAALQGLKHASVAQLTQSVGRTVYFLVFIGAALAVAGSTHLHPETAVVMQALAFAAAVVTGSIAIRRVLPREVVRSAPEFEGRKWAKSLPPLAFLTALAILNGQIGVIMLGAMGSAADTGRFNAALRSAALVSLALGAVGQVMAPRVSALYATGDRRAIERLLARGTRAASVLALPPALFLTLVGAWFLGLFGHGFREGSTALAILVAGQVFNAATGAVGMALVMTRHEKSVIMATVSGTCLNLVLCVLLIPGLGPTGAATATAASMVLINVLLMVAVVKKLQIRPTIFGILLPTIT